MAQILDYGPVTKFNTDDVFLIDGETDGTRTIASKDLYYASIDNAAKASNEVRRFVWRGKQLGDYVTDDQYAEIKAGTFRDLFLGDWWLIGGNYWEIVDFDYWFTSASTYKCIDHHVVIMPHGTMYDAQWHSATNVNNGYNSSYIHNGGLTSARNTITSLFGADHILSKPEVIISACSSSGIPISAKAITTTVEIPDEVMIFGERVHQQAVYSTSIPYRVSNSPGQLAGMAVGGRWGTKASSGMSYWLRDICYGSTGYVALVDQAGNANRVIATNKAGVRPVFAIKGV